MLRDGAKGEKRGREKVTGGVWALRQGWIQGTGRGAKGEGSLAWKARREGRKWMPRLLCDGHLARGIHTGHLVKSSVVTEVK